MKRTQPVAILLAILLLALPAVAQAPMAQEAATDDWRLVEEHWYVLEMMGQRAGYRHDIVHETDTRIRSQTEQRIVVLRDGRPNSVEAKVVYVEDRDGNPVQISTMTVFGRTPQTKSWVFEKGQVTETVTTGQRTRKRSIALPEAEFLTPMAEHLFAKARGASGATEITYNVLNLDVGLGIIHVKRELKETSTFQWEGRQIPVEVWNITWTGARDLEMTWHLSEDDVLVWSEERQGRFSTTARLATKEEALKPLGRRGDNAPPEVLQTLFVKPDRPIARVAQAEAATYRLRAIKDELPPIPSAGAQRTKPDESTGENQLIVTVDVTRSAPVLSTELDDPAYMKGSSLMDIDDPQVIALAERAVRSVNDDNLARAEAMRSAVHRHVRNKGLSQAFASASDTVRNRTGDCSEHAVLLGAMLRTQQIPSRVAIGLVYVEQFGDTRNFFGWHMWTQAMIDNTWVDLDATLPDRFHAGHILIDTLSLEEGSLDRQLGSMIHLMGNLAIDVVDVRHR